MEIINYYLSVTYIFKAYIHSLLRTTDASHIQNSRKLIAGIRQFQCVQQLMKYLAKFAANWNTLLTLYTCSLIMRVIASMRFE